MNKTAILFIMALVYTLNGAGNFVSYAQYMAELPPMTFPIQLAAGDMLYVEFDTEHEDGDNMDLAAIVLYPCGFNLLGSLVQAFKYSSNTTNGSILEFESPRPFNGFVVLQSVYPFNTNTKYDVIIRINDQDIHVIDDSVYTHHSMLHTDATLCTCGNGIVQRYETSNGLLQTCDDSNDTNCINCKLYCPADGPKTQGCQPCGNGVVQYGEQCDDGNIVDGDSCTSQCKNQVCGNGIVGLEQQCDQGQNNGLGRCNSDCTFKKVSYYQYMNQLPQHTFILQNIGETKWSIKIDTLSMDYTSQIRATHYLYQCGKNILGDDRNDWFRRSRLGYSINVTVNKSTPLILRADYHAVSQAGYLQYRLQIYRNDQLYLNQTRILHKDSEPGNYYVTNCQVCGDSRVDAAEYETCDDPLDKDCVYCKDMSCGNGKLQAIKGQECDDGGSGSGDGCSSGCQVEKCGNLILDYGEQCDDGNQVSGDGCSADCRDQCGNGVVDGDQQCDDGNSDEFDGCISSCKVYVQKDILEQTKNSDIIYIAAIIGTAVVLLGVIIILTCLLCRRMKQISTMEQNIVESAQSVKSTSISNYNDKMSDKM